MEETQTVRVLVGLRRLAQSEGDADRIAEIDAELRKIADQATTPAARSSKRPTPTSIARR